MNFISRIVETAPEALGFAAIGVLSIASAYPTKIGRPPLRLLYGIGGFFTVLIGYSIVVHWPLFTLTQLLRACTPGAMAIVETGVLTMTAVYPTKYGRMPARLLYGMGGCLHPPRRLYGRGYVPGVLLRFLPRLRSDSPVRNSTPLGMNLPITRLLNRI